jgi:putative ABC transport system ATP-binding protein
MIVLKGVGKKYQMNQIETQALRNVNLTIQEGEFVSVMGPSGSGKSTLMNVIGLIDSMSDGEYYYRNQLVSAYNEKQKTNLRKLNMGFVFQKFYLIDELSVYDNIEIPLSFFNHSAKEKKKRVLSIMERLHITDLAHKKPIDLSGGQQQRVAVARALVHSPQVVLADEPTGNLDSKNGEEVIRLFREFNQDGTTIVMITHSENYARMGSRVIILFDGEIVTDNFFENIRQTHQKKGFY